MSSDTEINMNSESDSESIITDVTDISICQDFDQIIDELYSIQQLQHNILQQTQQLSSYITSVSTPKIIVTYNTQQIELEDFLELINKESINNLQKNNKIEFGALLLKRLESCFF